MTPWAKAPATKPDHLSAIPAMHVVGGQITASYPLVSTCTPCPPHKQINKLCAGAHGHLCEYVKQSEFDTGHIPQSLYTLLF